MKQRRYCGKGDVIEKREFSSEQLSWVMEREDIGRTCCVRRASDCNSGIVLENQ
jgi:hypothetical protein